MKKNKNILRFAEHKVIADKKNMTKTVWFKVLKVLLYIVGTYSLLVSLTMILGCLFTIDEYSTKSNPDEIAICNEAMMQLWSMVISIAATVASFVLLRLKKALPFGILGFVNCLVAFIVFHGASVKNDIRNGGQVVFWSTFGVPSIVFAIIVVAVATIMIIEKMRVNKAYEGYVSAIYNTYSEGGSKTLSSAEYEKIMDNYNGQELFRSDIPLKKSLKRRKQKQDAALADDVNENKKSEN